MPIVGRHAVTYCYLLFYVIFSGYVGCPTDMRNSNPRIVLCKSKVPIVGHMRNFHLHKEMWPSPLFSREVVRLRSLGATESSETSQSGDDVFDDCAVDVGQAEVPAGVAIVNCSSSKPMR